MKWGGGGSKAEVVGKGKWRQKENKKRRGSSKRENVVVTANHTPCNYHCLTSPLTLLLFVTPQPPKLTDNCKISINTKKEGQKRLAMI